MRWLLFASAWLVFGCTTNSRLKNDVTSSGDVTELPSRAEAVLRADEYAALAERVGGARGTVLFNDAARLRERLFRLERRKSDALEASDYYRAAGKLGDCMSTLRGVALSAELGSDPGLVGRELGSLDSAPHSVKCADMIRSLRAVTGAAVPQTRAASVSQVHESDVEPGKESSEVISPNLPDGHRSGGVQVTRVERYAGKDAARIVISLSEAATYRALLLRSVSPRNSVQLSVDIDGATLAEKATYAVGGLVTRVTLERRGGSVRILLDLDGPSERRVFYMPEPFRIVVDVFRPSSSTLSLKQRAIERVVIDPGHGGSDPGAIGPSGLREKDVTLDIAHRVGPLIARELGLSTLLTRDTDVFVALDERAARANAFRADLFVSIHCNAAEHSGSDGVFTFVLDNSTDAAASRVAALENAASQAAARELERSLAPAQDEGVLARSLHFAELLQRSASASLSKDYGRIAHQGVRRAGFYVLAGAHMPAVLYEVTFISNPDGEVRLNTADYRQRLADSIVNAVRAYRDGI